ncbi:MAG TPA: VOC family protein [Saprospiraceae bacterium]|nr:VOC family protein [Saprospiraceae bacterium]
MTLKLDTIIIFVKDLASCKDFYVHVLGLEILEETPKQWLLLSTGGCNIGLHQIGEEYLDESNEDTEYETNTKIVFEIDGDIHTLRNDLLSKNVTIKEVMTWDNYPYLLCDGQDPEGNVFQLKGKKV